MVKKLNTKIKFKKVQIFLLLIVGVFFTGLFVFNYYYIDKIYPGIWVAGQHVGGKTTVEAAEIIKSKINSPENISVYAKEEKFELSLKDIDFKYDVEKTLGEAYGEYRNGSLFANMIGSLSSFFIKKEKELAFNVDEEKLDEYLGVISTQLKVEPVKPTAIVNKGIVVVDKGAPGQEIDKENFTNILYRNLTERTFSDIELSFNDSDPALSDTEAEEFKKRAEKLLGKKVKLNHEYDQYLLTEKELIGFLNARNGYRDEVVEKYITATLSPKVNREPQDAVFKFEEGKVMEFKPAKNGAVINIEYLKSGILSRMDQLEKEDLGEIVFDIPIQSTNPKITTNEVNDLGINELVGRGTSKFKGSIPGRVHNIGLASSKLNGVLIPPGETFSFNSAVGDVSSLTGYKQAYIIKDGKTVLGDGGGLCQVSTTLFRATMNAGLPITERRAHSYRVGYYEQDSGPGMDATVFSPTTDFKFTNDTPKHLLIQTIFNAKDMTLVFEIYGTSDGRVATIGKPILSNVSAPPADLYVDDPTIPAGQVRQIEHKAWGAKATFSYKVVRNGETLTDRVFVSNYRPWQAVFLKGTAPAI